MNESSAELLDAINSTPAEEYVIGAALHDGSVIDEYGSVVLPDMFGNRAYGAFWKRMCELRIADKPADFSGLLMEAPQLVERIGMDKLTAIFDGYLGPHSVSYHMDKLIEISARRKIIQGAAELQKHAHDTARISVDELKSEYERIALEFSETIGGNGLKSGLDLTARWVEGVEARYKNPNTAYGVMTGWKDLDRLTLGWQPKDLVVVGGRTSVGKTAFAIENLIRAQRAGHKVAMFSLEMSAEQVRNRIAGNLGQVRLSYIRTGRLRPNELGAVTDAQCIDLISNIAIDESRGVTVDYLVAEMKRWKRTHGLDFVVVDYIQEVYEPPQANDNAGSALGRIVRKLRKAAMDCNCTVMALSQLNREADGKPRLQHLSGSSGIESAADVVILLHRDKKEDPHTLQVEIAKQRNGPTGEVKLYYEPALQRIENLTTEQEVS